MRWLLVLAIAAIPVCAVMLLIIAGILMVAHFPAFVEGVLQNAAQYINSLDALVPWIAVISGFGMVVYVGASVLASIFPSKSLLDEIRASQEKRSRLDG